VSAIGGHHRRAGRPRPLHRALAGNPSAHPRAVAKRERKRFVDPVCGRVGARVACGENPEFFGRIRSLESGISQGTRTQQHLQQTQSAGESVESQTLVQQANHNIKEQFSNSPALTQAILDAIIDAFEAHTTMSKQALDSEQARDGLKEVLSLDRVSFMRLSSRATGGGSSAHLAC
jgi:hypothetical protein